jgi:translation elongation factor EF-4
MSILVNDEPVDALSMLVHAGALNHAAVRWWKS